MKDCYFNPLQREAEDLQGRLQADTQNISIHFSAKLKTYHRHTAGNPVVFQSTSARSWRPQSPCFASVLMLFQSTSARSWRRQQLSFVFIQIPISIHFSAKLKTHLSGCVWWGFLNFNPLQREAEDLTSPILSSSTTNFNPLQREAEDVTYGGNKFVAIDFNPLQREAEDSKYNQFHLSPNTFPYTNPPTLPIPFSFSSPKTSHKPYFYNYISVRIPPQIYVRLPFAPLHMIKL